MKLPDFYTLVYPNEFRESHNLIPDALLVRKKENAYKLTFLEVEAKKFNWIENLEKKRDNYLRLASDYRIYYFWKKNAE